jgi:hypothetical protein
MRKVTQVFDIAHYFVSGYTLDHSDIPQAQARGSAKNNRMHAQ